MGLVQTVFFIDATLPHMVLYEFKTSHSLCTELEGGARAGAITVRIGAGCLGAIRIVWEKHVARVRAVAVGINNWTQKAQSA